MTILLTNNSLSEDHSHPDDHTRQTTEYFSWVNRDQDKVEFVSDTEKAIYPYFIES